MDQSENLALPFILPAQAQKHVTHNEAISALDALIHISVPEAATSAPPSSPSEGQRHIVATEPTGAWQGRSDQIAAFQDGAWRYYTPRTGWLAWIEDTRELRVWTGESWEVASEDLPDIFPQIGINTSADETNRLAVASKATLLTHAGTDHRVFVNKAEAGNTASVLFQTGFSGRAEFGLTGDDNWRVNVSPDGTSWNEALIADAETGAVSLPQGLHHHLSGRQANSLIITPGGQGEIWAYSIAPPHASTPRTFTIAGSSGDIIRLTTPDAALIYRDSAMANVSYLRVWNISKSTPESAWVARTEGPDGLQVLNAGDITGWASGETLQVGDPSSITPGRVIALDISPYLQNQLGAVFPQSALLTAMVIRTTGGQGEMAVSPNGGGGTFSNAFTPNDGALVSVEATTPTTVRSPISNSNLLFLREDVPPPGLIDVCQCRIKGVWV